MSNAIATLGGFSQCDAMPRAKRSTDSLAWDCAPRLNLGRENATSVVLAVVSGIAPMAPSRVSPSAVVANPALERFFKTSWCFLRSSSSLGWSGQSARTAACSSSAFSFLACSNCRFSYSCCWRALTAKFSAILTTIGTVRSAVVASGAPSPRALEMVCPWYDSTTSKTFS